MLEPDEIVLAVRISKLKEGERDFFWKVGTRRAQAISKTVMAARATAADGRININYDQCRSVAPTVVRAPETESLLTGQTLTPDLIKQASESIANEISPSIRPATSTHTLPPHGDGQRAGKAPATARQLILLTQFHETGRSFAVNSIRLFAKKLEPSLLSSSTSATPLLASIQRWRLTIFSLARVVSRRFLVLPLHGQVGFLSRRAPGPEHISRANRELPGPERREYFVTRGPASFDGGARRMRVSPLESSSITPTTCSRLSSPNTARSS